MDRAAREAGLGGLHAYLKAVDADYDRYVIQRRPADNLREWHCVNRHAARAPVRVD